MIKLAFRAGLALLSLTVLPFYARALTVSPVRLELAGDPGGLVNGEFVLMNEQVEAKTFFSSFENFDVRGEEGAPRFFPGTTDLATWITTLPQAHLEPGGQRAIPFSIQIPPDAIPGGHFAAIFWGTTPPQAQEETQVSVGAKVGILVLLRVSGEIKEGGGLNEFGIKDHQFWFTSPPVSFYYKLQNNGGDRVKPAGQIEIRNVFRQLTVALPANENENNVLPASARKFEVLWGAPEPELSPPSKTFSERARQFFREAQKQRAHFALGPYTARLNVVYGTNNMTAQAQVRFWVLPWQLLITATVAALLIIFILVKGIKTYNRWIIAHTPIKRPGRKKRS